MLQRCTDFQVSAERAPSQGGYANAARLRERCNLVASPFVPRNPLASWRNSKPDLYRNQRGLIVKRRTFLAGSGLVAGGLLLGGWSSGSKYSFLGAMRSAAQLISYEIAMALSLFGVILMAGSLSLVDIVRAQGEMWFIVPQIVGFLVFMISGFAETNRAPFDLPEADAELVQGYSTEYGGMRFGSFFMAEYMEILVVSGIASVMFFGGWMGPGPGWLDPIWMLLKMSFFVCLFIWVRATLPRLRYDQLMALGWKVMLPLATLNAVVTAVLVVVL